MQRTRNLRGTAGWLCRAGFAGLILAGLSATAVAWETAHGRPDNTGFADIVTAPAKTPRIVGNLGSFAPGAGPVVAPDGTVYVGNEQGKLMSFRPDGTPGWSRDLNRGEAILASPAIGSDGSVYVIGVRQYTDNRVEPPVKRVDSTLHRFTASGGWLSQSAFPEHNRGGGGTTAAPNLWRFNGVELIMVPAPYRREVGGGVDIRLLAFSTNGALVADQRATSIVPEVSGGGGIPGWFIPVCMMPPIGTIACFAGGPSEFTSAKTIPPPPPFPGVGMHTNPLGGTPWIMLSDHYKDLVGFTFSLADYKFYEVFRVHENDRFLRSAPSFIPDQHAIIGTEEIKRDDDGVQSGNERGGVIFSGPNQSKVAPITGLQAIYGPATRLWDGRTALVGAGGELVLMNGTQVTARVTLASGSISGATASRTHLFVATQFGLQTFDPASLTEVARVDWSGGRSRAVIGPQGHVYAVAGNALFAFAPTASAAADEPQNPTPAPTAQSQAYNPPLTTNGNRLFACRELDGDDCGKGDARAIAKAFCAKQGFAQAGNIDVDGKKVKAETLGGQFCSKKKCKVFERIVCTM